MSDTVQSLPTSRAPLSLALIILGLIGAASFYLSTLPIPAEYADIISPESFRIQTMVGPIIMVLIAGALGHFFAHRAGLSAPFLASALAGRADFGTLRAQAISAGISAAVFLGVALSAHPLIALTGIEPALAELNAFTSESLHPGTQVLYGAFAEEIIMRWGLFSVIAVGSLKLIGGFSREGALVLAIVITSLIVNAIHAPTLGQVLETPPAMLVLLTQSLGFLASALACHLYMRRGLEAAILFKLTLIIISLFLSGTTLIG